MCNVGNNRERINICSISKLLDKYNKDVVIIANRYSNLTLIFFL
jgi:hypothetical protein